VVAKRKPPVTTARLVLDPSLDERTVLSRYLDYREQEVHDARLTKNELLTIGTELISRAQ
jgi:hypothetical protein